MKEKSIILINALIDEGLKQLDEMILISTAKNDQRNLKLAYMNLELFTQAKEDMSKIIEVTVNE